jgi:DNA-binding NarL/FixJ family response regulator
LPLNVGVVDEDEVFRRGLATILAADPEIAVRIEAASGPIGEPDLDVLVVSWRSLPTLDASCPVVLLASTPSRAAAGSQDDIVAVLPRDGLTGDKLILAVRAAAAGLRVDAVGVEDDRPPPVALDDRHLKVLRLLASGSDTRAVAQRLRYSERTVKTYIRDIEAALGAQTRAQAVAEAVRLGLI